MNHPKRVKLSPFAHVVKGAKNYALFDLHGKKVYGIIPEGDVEEFKKQLVDMKLAVETDGVVPFKYEKTINKYDKYYEIRELQLRITGQCEQNCSDCGSTCSCFKSAGDMTEDVLEKVIENFRNISLQKIRVTGGSPFQRKDLLKKTRNGFSASSFEIFFKGVLEKSGIEFAKDIGYVIDQKPYLLDNIQEENILADDFLFFYSKKYNPCWGHKIAIDTDGSIRVCLWNNEILGNILKDDIKTMIRNGCFDKFWTFTRDHVEYCRECEFRYGCMDCPNLIFAEAGQQDIKSIYCKYNPIQGTWE